MDVDVSIKECVRKKHDDDRERQRRQEEFDELYDDVACSKELFADNNSSSSSGDSFKDVKSGGVFPESDLLKIKEDFTEAQFIVGGVDTGGSCSPMSSSSPPATILINETTTTTATATMINANSSQQQLSGGESDKSSNKSDSNLRKKSKLTLDQNFLTSNNNVARSGLESSDPSRTCSKESVFSSAAGDQKSVGPSPSPKSQTKQGHELRKSSSTVAAVAGGGQEKNVIQAAASQLKNFLAPNYKSRNEEFKRLFRVPDSEKFIIDYSCAYQREILVHGRMYLSQNWLCFYANIFRWETSLTIPMKDITKISKERTAKVIPNAIQICTKSGEKLFFTSFATRDKTHMVIFRLWQSSLLDQFEQPAELWAWAQTGYNEADLSDSDEIDDDGGSAVTDNSGVGGLKSCDSQVCVSSTFKNKNPRVDSSSKRELASAAASDYVEDSEENESRLRQRHKRRLKSSPSKLAGLAAASPLMLNTPAMLPVLNVDDEYSDSSSDDVEVQCSCVDHHGKEMLNEVFPISVDQMFLLLFTDSVFFRQLQEFRKTTNMSLSEWHTDKNSGVKSREVSYHVALNHSMGPKSCGVCEKQICAQCSKSGSVYVVKCECQNSGVPYADTFYVITTYCMSKVGSSHCRLKVHGGVAYRKSCWGIVKSFIEKNALVGIQDYFNDLNTQLTAECERLGLTPREVQSIDGGGGVKRKASGKSSRSNGVEDIYSASLTKKSMSLVFPIIPSEIESLTKAILLILVLMLLLNAMLFYKLWYFEAQSGRLSFESTLYDLQKLLQNPELSPADWMKMFHQERLAYHKQSSKWALSLQDTLSAIEQIETALKDLRSQMKVIRADFLNWRYSSNFDDEDSSASKPVGDKSSSSSQQNKPLHDFSGL